MKSAIDDGFGRANESLNDDDRVSKSRRDFYTIRFKSFVSHSGGGTNFLRWPGSLIGVRLAEPDPRHSRSDSTVAIDL